MGKSTVLIVMATVLSGMFMLLNMQTIRRSTTQRQLERQEDVIARDLAESAQEIALQKISDGSSFNVRSKYRGGWIEAGGQIVDGAYRVTTEGRYGGATSDGKDIGSAVHRIATSYIPGRFKIPPCVFKSMYTNFAIHDDAEMDLGEDGGCLFGIGDMKKLAEDGQLTEDVDADLIDTTAVKNNIMGQLDKIGVDAGDLTFTDAMQEYLDHMMGEDEGAFEQMHDELTRQAADPSHEAHSAADHVYGGENGEGLVVETNDWVGHTEVEEVSHKNDDGSAAVVHIKGDLIIRGSQERRARGGHTYQTGRGKLSGQGALIIDGNLTVEEGAALDWEGVVYIKRSGEEYAKVDLSGNVNIDGSLIAQQETLPPGGHMDVTVWASRDGAWAQAYGNIGSSLGCGPMKLSSGDDCSPRSGNRFRPWWSHTHKYDAATGTRSMPFLQAGNGPGGSFRGRLRLNEYLDGHGANGETYYLTFDNPQKSGFATFNIDIRGADGYTGEANRKVIDGFEQGFEQYRSKAFERGDLRHLEINVQGLSGLRRLFNEAAQDCYYGEYSGNCPELSPGYQVGQVTDYPVWTGNDRNREGAFTISLHRSSDNALLYQAAAYWHKKPQEQEQERQNQLDMISDVNDGDWGMDFICGENCSLTNNEAMKNLVRARLENIFGPNRGYNLTGAWAQHWSAGEQGQNHPYE